MTAAILVVNSGSSSIKFALYAAESGDAPLFAGGIAGLGHAARLAVHDANDAKIADLPLGQVSHDGALEALLTWVEDHSGGVQVRAAGHRVVHGGADFTAPVMVTPGIIERLDALSALAPQHQPHNLAAIRALARLHPSLPQIACFDTAFHAAQPAIATAFALPRALTDEGIRRYGFHGLSYDYIASVLPEHLGAKADGKIVVAHLGHGASMCAMERRRSVATTMGFSALDGLMMGTRSGAIDPGVLLYLLDRKGMTAQELSTLLYDKSGLLGVSGESDDMHALLESSSAHATEAIALFVYRIARELGSLCAALGGLDALVFTAGIGEHSPEIRAMVCRQAAWLGVAVDEAANVRGDVQIGAKDGHVAILALPTNEEIVIAQAVRKFMAR